MNSTGNEILHLTARARHREPFERRPVNRSSAAAVPSTDERADDTEHERGIEERRADHAARLEQQPHRQHAREEAVDEQRLDPNASSARRHLCLRYP
ncbi:MAG: hypothetical protein QM702_03605 [Rubrivivax sp.]